MKAQFWCVRHFFTFGIRDYSFVGESEQKPLKSTFCHYVSLLRVDFYWVGACKSVALLKLSLAFVYFFVYTILTFFIP